MQTPRPCIWYLLRAYSTSAHAAAAAQSSWLSRKYGAGATSCSWVWLQCRRCNHLGSTVAKDHPYFQMGTHKLSISASSLPSTSISRICWRLQENENGRTCLSSLRKPAASDLSLKITL